MSRLSLDFCGLKLNSPIVLLSGCVGFGEEYTRIEGFSNTEVGAIVLKGTTFAPRLAPVFVVLAEGLLMLTVGAMVSVCGWPNNTVIAC